MLTRIQSKIEPGVSAQVNPDHPLARGLAACWLLNEAAGRVVHDASGQRHHGAFSGGPTWSIGASGRAIEFDGDDDWISMGNCLNLGTTDITVLALVRYSVANQPDLWGSTRAGAIVGKGYLDGGGKGYGLFVDTSNRVGFQVRNQATSRAILSDAALNDGRWHLIVATCARNSTTGLRLYVNGLLQSDIGDPTVLSGMALDGSRAFAIGSRQDQSTGGWFWDFAGSVAMVGVWMRVLAEAEILELQRDPFRCFASRRVLAVPTGAAVRCAGSIDAAASTSAALRVTRRLAGTTAASASVGAALRVERRISLSGTTGGRSTLHGVLETVSPRPPLTTARETGMAWRSEALVHGATHAAFMLGTSVTHGWFWVRRAGCAAVYRGSDIMWIDLGRILHVAEPGAGEIVLPVYLPHTPGSTYCYLVRRFDSCGRQEKTWGAAVVLRIGPDGQLAAGQPNTVVGLKSEQTGRTRVRLVWFYCSLDQKAAPQKFNVYWNGGAGDVDLEIPLGVIPYEGRRFYWYQSDPLADGRYTFIVRAAGADGVEAPPSLPLVHEITTAPPASAVILAAGCV